MKKEDMNEFLSRSEKPIDSAKEAKQFLKANCQVDISLSQPKGRKGARVKFDNF